PVKLDCAGNMSLLVEQDVLVCLDDPQTRVVQMFGDPVGLDKYLGMGISVRGHRFPLFAPRTQVREPSRADTAPSGNAARGLTVRAGVRLRNHTELVGFLDNRSR